MNFEGEAGKANAAANCGVGIHSVASFPLTGDCTIGGPKSLIWTEQKLWAYFSINTFFLFTKRKKILNYAPQFTYMRTKKDIPEYL